MANPVIFVNIIDVEPQKQEGVINILKDGSENVISKRPSFISVSLLASLDGKCVVNIARWQSADDVKRTQTDPESADFAKRTAQIASASPGLYRVVGEYS